VLFGAVYHELPLRMQSTMSSLEERRDMGCGEGLAPQWLQAAYVADVAM